MIQEVVQEIENTVRDGLKGIHTAMPGEITSFDPGSGRATVKPNGQYTSSSGKRMAYPQISDVPVAFPVCQSAGGNRLSGKGRGQLHHHCIRSGTG